MPDNHTSAIAWELLTEALQDGNAVLILGPGAEEITLPNGRLCTLQTLLAEHLAQKIKHYRPDLQLSHPDNLSYVAQHFEDVHGKQATTLLGYEVSKFYEQYNRTEIPFYRQIARLNFRYIINTNPNKLLIAAYKKEGYLTAQKNFAYYHNHNAFHNQSIQISEKDINERTPLIYNLFGTQEDIGSLVLTDTQQIQLIDHVLQGDTGGIPTNVAIHFLSRGGSLINKHLVFVGFDFNDWRLRFILHLINRYQLQSAAKSYAPQKIANLEQLTQFFYRRNFNFDFIDTNIGDFLTQLQQTSVPTAPTPQLRIVIIYHDTDVDICHQLEEQLAPLKRQQKVSIWHRAKIAAATEIDREIAKQIEAAHLVLALISSDFLADEQLLSQQFAIAAQRHLNGSLVVPIIAGSCHWQIDTLFEPLRTILPLPNGNPPIRQNNIISDETISQVAQEIADICEGINDN
ncbi:MAG: SIR2 family protein [Chitinophagales bacterium]|nr:SIR2 family protein [Chitinophagales bacterium]